MRNINALKSNAEFREVYKNGTSVANKYLVLYAYKNDGGKARLGISVSKKVGNSVVRHRLSRLIRESYLTEKEHLKDGFSLVVVARVRAKDALFSDICGSFKYLCEKQNLL